jgi:outer membrane protein TolC
MGCATQAGRQVVRDANAEADLAAYRASAPGVSEPVTLAAALDYASRYNIELWIADQERQFQRELATHSMLKMLPSLMTGAEHSRRSRFDAATSISLQSGEESLEPSYSSEKTRDVWDIAATWSVLDFGISYLRARQQVAREWIAAERQRRVRQNLQLQVASTYWRAVTARESALLAEQIAGEVERMLEELRGEARAQTLSEREALTREVRLLEQLEELRRYKRFYLSAKTELATLMGLPPGAEFSLAEIDLDLPAGEFDPDIAELERAALRQRPELFEKDDEQAISRDEAHIAIAEMFPNLSLFWRYDINDDRLLAFREWQTAGLRVSWDLLTIPQQIQKHEAMQLQTELVARRRTALAVGILTQLHLALIDCEEGAAQYAIWSEIALRHRDLLAAIQSAVDSGKSNGGEALDQRLKYLKARARQLDAYANLQSARARLVNSIGEDIRPDNGDTVGEPAAGASTSSQEQAEMNTSPEQRETLDTQQDSAP